MDTHAGCWQAAWQASTVSAGTIVCRPLLPKESRQHPRFCSHAACAFIWHRAPSTHSVLATATCTSNSTSTWKATTEVRCTACTALFRAIAMAHLQTWQRRRALRPSLTSFRRTRTRGPTSLLFGAAWKDTTPLQGRWLVSMCHSAGVCWRDDAVLSMARVASRLIISNLIRVI